MTRLTDWFRANKLSMNVGKTVCVLFQKDPTPKTVILNVDGTEIHSLKEVKFLACGLTLNSTGQTTLKN